MLTDGDDIYLYDSEHIYRHLWEACYVVGADDWSPIYTTGYSCIAMTSCHPIGISDRRIVVCGILAAIMENDGNNTFPKAAAEEMNP